ncbi:MAG: phosphoribosylanthranilate isomerase [Kiritimatiellae bacterium]|nr:phosphoribosylanthranilate isomerase [Kiritimatiellia bacterium]
MKAPLKICGLTTPEDAQFCAAAGAAALGAVFYPPSPRNVTPERAGEVFADVPPDIARVGVFVDATAADILRAARLAGLGVAQLPGAEPPALAAELLAAGLRVLKVLRGGDLAAEAARYPDGTRFLVECGRGALPGGNGAAWDWRAARALAPRPFALAGGLAPDNLAAAAAASGAVFFDLSSAVESAPGRKDRDKVRAAVAAAGTCGGDVSFLA